MKNFLTSLIFSLSCLLASAQQDRFIYLQTDNQQPFFVKLNNQVFNSYPLGYVIIPRLDEGLYSLVVGFPGSDYEQEFNCPVRNKDVGFSIKSVGERQWQLVNLQTRDIIVPGDVITKPVIVYEKETDPFSVMLANAVHDSTILRKDVTKEIVTEKPAELTINDSSQIIAINNDAAVPKISITDSAAKDVAKEVAPELKDRTPKNPSDSVSTAVVTPENSVSDSAKTVVKEVTSEVISNDSAIAVNPNVISNVANTLKTDSTANTDLAKQPTEKKADEIVQTDSLATKMPDVALTRAQKRKARRNDNALQESTLTQPETVKVIPEKTIEIKDSVQDTSSITDAAILKSAIKRKSRKTNKDGIEMMYIDDYGDGKDTIRILIPSEKKLRKDAEINAEPVVITPVQDETKKTDVDPGKNADSKLSDKEKKIIQEAKDPGVKSTMINSDCKNFATEEDFLKARKKMVAEDNDEDMIKAAKKIFKTRCFTTEQIKNLSVLFLKDEGKYMFFDAAYPFASDSDLYSTLESQLTDNYYITRFRAMIHK